MAETHPMDAVRHALGGHEDKPAKRISHIVHRKSHNGDHIFEHHHTHPEHHPVEVHTKRGDDEMVEHMMEHAGTPNPGEAEADAGNPESYNGPSGNGADAAAAPSAGSGDAAPGAGAAAMGALTNMADSKIETVHLSHHRAMMHLRKGGLHRALHIPEDQEIPQNRTSGG